MRSTQLELFQSVEFPVPNKGDHIAVWFSCGAASAVAAIETVRLYKDMCEISIVNNPVKEEHEDNIRFLKDVQDYLGINIKFATHKKYPDCSAKQVWTDRNFMSSPYGAPCTMLLKKEARQQWESTNPVDWHVLGFTLDERKRYDRFVQTERENVLPILIQRELTKNDCLAYIKDIGIELPLMYKLGYPNANCIGCVKSASVTYWNHVRKTHPDVFKDRAEQSRKLGVKLVKYKRKRIFLDELPEDAVGRSMTNLNFECGIFCEEKID